MVLVGEILYGCAESFFWNFLAKLCPGNYYENAPKTERQTAILAALIMLGNQLIVPAQNFRVRMKTKIGSEAFSRVFDWVHNLQKMECDEPEAPVIYSALLWKFVHGYKTPGYY